MHFSKPLQVAAYDYGKHGKPTLVTAVSSEALGDIESTGLKHCKCRPDANLASHNAVQHGLESHACMCRLLACTLLQCHNAATLS